MSKLLYTLIKVVATVSLLALILTGCFNPYYDSDEERLDKDALAYDAVDLAFPEIMENMTEENIEEMMQNKEIRSAILQCLTHEDIKQLASERLWTDSEFCEYGEAYNLIIDALGGTVDAQYWADELPSMSFMEIVDSTE